MRRSRLSTLAVAASTSVVAALAIVSAAVAMPAPASTAGPMTAAAAGPTTTAPAGPTTTAAPGPTTTAAPLPRPPDAERDPVRTLVPSIVIAPRLLSTPEEQRPVVVAALEERRNSIAVNDAPGTMCAVVPIQAPLMAGGRWEHDGEEIAAAELLRRDPTGYGDCITPADVGAFDAGVYQYVVTGPTGATSAAATLVVGATPVVVWLLNDGDEPVCLVQLSPRDADFYEAFDADSPLLPGEALAVRIASVEQDVRVFGCPPDRPLRSFGLTPQFGVYVDLFGGDEPAGSPPPRGSATPAANPTTTTNG